MVLGPGSTGSVLIAKTIAHVLGVKEWGTWDGRQWAKSEDQTENNVFHLSLPAFKAPELFKGKQDGQKDKTT